MQAHSLVNLPRLPLVQPPQALHPEVYGEAPSSRLPCPAPCGQPLPGGDCLQWLPRRNPPAFPQDGIGAPAVAAAGIISADVVLAAGQTLMRSPPHYRPHTRMERTCSGRFGPEPSMTGPRNVANLFIQLGEELWMIWSLKTQRKALRSGSQKAAVLNHCL